MWDRFGCGRRLILPCNRALQDNFFWPTPRRAESFICLGVSSEANLMGGAWLKIRCHWLKVAVLLSYGVYDGMPLVIHKGVGRNEGRAFDCLVLMLLGLEVDGRGAGRRTSLVGVSGMNVLDVLSRYAVLRGNLMLLDVEGVAVVGPEYSAKEFQR